MKLTVVSAEKIKIADGDGALLLIQISDIPDWNSVDATLKLAHLIKTIESACQKSCGLETNLTTTIRNLPETRQSASGMG